MKLHPKLLITASLGGVILLGACKESTKKDSTGSSGSSSGGESSASATKDPATDGYVLYSEESKLPDGAIVIETKSMKMKDGTLLIDMGAQKIEGSSSMHSNKKEITTYVSKDERKLQIVEDHLDQVMKIQGREMKQPRKSEKLVGKTLLLSKKDGKWSAALDGGGSSAGMESEISKEAKKTNSPDDKYIAGTTPRKVGDTWEVDVTKLSSFQEGDSPATGTFKVTFKGIEEHDGHKCAVLVTDMDINSEHGKGMNMNLKGTMTTYRSLKHLINLKSTGNATMTMKGDIPNGKMNMEGPMEINETREIKLP